MESFIKIIFSLLLISLLHLNGIGQTKTEFGYILPVKIENGDSIPLATLKTTQVLEKRVFKSKYRERRYNRLKRNVIKVYPYAKLAGIKLKKYNDSLTQMSGDVKRRKFMKNVEKELKVEFGGKLKKLTVTQGRILISLIDRETGDTSYELVKELRGGLSAFMWQGLARIFGHNLKSKYDPIGDQKDIEEIVLLIESGVYPLKTSSNHKK